MHNRLTHSSPELHVRPEVAFGALPRATLPAARNTFDRKGAEFVVCEAAFNVRAVIEPEDKIQRERTAIRAKKPRKNSAPPHTA